MHELKPLQFNDSYTALRKGIEKYTANPDDEDDLFPGRRTGKPFQRGAGLQAPESKKSAVHFLCTGQTLYHRLERIKQVPGDDFTDSVKRLAVETAVKGYQLLKETM